MPATTIAAEAIVPVATTALETAITAEATAYSIDQRERSVILNS
jgi:hypothetical protein